MYTLKDQIEWEAECRQRGADKYYARQDVLREKGRTEQTDSFQYILHSKLAEVGEAIEADIMSGNAGIQNKYNKLLRKVKDYGVSSHAMAFFGLQVVIKALSEHKRSSSNRVTRVCGSIGERLETEVRCILFEKTDPEFYKKSLELIAKNDIVSYSAKRQVMTARLKQVKATISWTPALRVGVGSKILRAIENALDGILYIEVIPNGPNKSVSIISTTPEFDEWCGNFEREAGLLEPSLLPLKVAPVDWKEDLSGGYHTPQMQVRFPFIKTKCSEHAAFVEQFTPHMHIAAVNKIQKTAWCINKQVLDVVEQVFKHGLGHGIPSTTPIVVPELPEHLACKDKSEYTDKEKEEMKYWRGVAKATYLEDIRRKGRVLQFMQTLNLARELRDWHEFYFAYSCDFRGRVYCATTALSPQSNDVARSLLLFKEEVPLGEEGITWLALRGASMFGIKGTYEHRLQWVREHGTALAQRVTANPIDDAIWAQADEPWQFLAWCFEWTKVKWGTDPTAKSSLVVGIDGSCNGLQHFSAILRDPIGAKATNLSKCDEPQDIYQEVANVVVAELRAREDGVAELYLELEIVDRSTTKRQCMTLPYGSTQQSCRDYTFEWVKANWEVFNLPKYDQWHFADYLAPIIWEAIGKVVVAARKGMEWLQKNVSKRYVKWVSPVGFPVYQYYKKVKSERVETQLAGRVRLTTCNLDSKGEPNYYKQRLGIVPNFIHSVDASHMVMTINGTELPAYSMIHDEFGCHAGHVQRLYQATRVQFYQLHNSCNPLELWAQHQGIPLEYVPQRGDFDIAEVLESKYIFG